MYVLNLKDLGESFVISDKRGSEYSVDRPLDFICN